jgi:methionyl-tRNA formyltransferase
MTSSSGLRIVYFGTPEFAAYILRHLLDNGENVVGVVTVPDKPQGRGQRLGQSAVKQAASEWNIPVLQPSKHRDPEFLGQLASLKADLFVVVAYKILPKEVFGMPSLGTFNVHASLLPKYRGAAPINWAIIRGEKETGVTTFLLDEQVDTGSTLLTKQIEIGPSETAGELHDKLMVLGAEAALETIRGLADGSLASRPQPMDGATTAPKIFPKDCVIDFNRPAEEVHNFIRGLSPSIVVEDSAMLRESRAAISPGAVVILPSGVRLKLLRSTLAPDVPQNLMPGTFLSSHNRLFVGTSTHAIELTELQREGKRAMNSEEFLRGNISLFPVS